MKKEVTGLRVYLLDNKVCGKIVEEKLRGELSSRFEPLEIVVVNPKSTVRVQKKYQVQEGYDVYLIHDSLFIEAHALKELREGNPESYIAIRRTIAPSSLNDRYADKIDYGFWGEDLGRKIVAHQRGKKK